MAAAGRAGLLLLLDLASLDPRVGMALATCLSFIQAQDLALAVRVRWPDAFLSYARWVRWLQFGHLLVYAACSPTDPADQWASALGYGVALPLAALALAAALAPAASAVAGRRVGRAVWRVTGGLVAWCVSFRPL